MVLSNYKVGAGLAVSDMDRAREFYEQKLGLGVSIDSGDNVQYRCAEGSVMHVYLSPEHAGRSTATLVGWDVDDIEAVVDELISEGVRFEHYDEPGLELTRRASLPSRARPRSPTSKIRTATHFRSPRHPPDLRDRLFIEARRRESLRTSGLRSSPKFTPDICRWRHDAIQSTPTIPLNLSKKHESVGDLRTIVVCSEQTMRNPTDGGGLYEESGRLRVGVAGQRVGRPELDLPILD